MSKDLGRTSQENPEKKNFLIFPFRELCPKRLKKKFLFCIYRVFTELRPKVNTFFSGRKNYLTEVKIKYIKFQIMHL